MTLTEAGVFWIVQGITQSLPISCITHLRAISGLLGWDAPGAGFRSSRFMAQVS